MNVWFDRLLWRFFVLLAIMFAALIVVLSAVGQEHSDASTEGLHIAVLAVFASMFFGLGLLQIWSAFRPSSPGGVLRRLLDLTMGLIFVFGALLPAMALGQAFGVTPPPEFLLRVGGLFELVKWTMGAAVVLAFIEFFRSWMSSAERRPVPPKNR